MDLAAHQDPKCKVSSIAASRRATLPPMVPTYLNTPADFAAAIQIGVTPESLVLDFKTTVPVQDPKEPKELCRDVAQFANTGGGCLVVGVEEKLDPVTRLKTASGIKPVAEPDKLTKWLEQAIRNWLVPATFSHAIVPIQTPVGIVLAVNVLPSQHTVYLWDGKSRAIEVLHRTSHGKDWMNPDELERHIMDGSRAAKIRIEEVLKTASRKEVNLMGGYYQQPGIAETTSVAIREPVQLGGIGDMAFELRIPFRDHIYGLQVPFEVLRSAWVAVDGGVSIMLTVRVVWMDQSFTLLPYDA
jgi:Putative DNA-binding domain